MTKSRKRPYNLDEWYMLTDERRAQHVNDWRRQCDHDLKDLLDRILNPPPDVNDADAHFKLKEVRMVLASGIVKIDAARRKRWAFTPEAVEEAWRKITEKHEAHKRAEAIRKAERALEDPRDRKPAKGRYSPWP